MKECQLCKNCYTDEVQTCPKDGMPCVHTLAGEPVLEGKYQLECRLGQGGMGVVYKARHAFLKTQLAIKIILPDLVGNDPQLVTRFRQEALAAAAIRHQNVVGVTDYGVIGGSIPYLVMEYVEGESLHDLLAREKVLSPERALDLMSAIAAGVGAAHHQGIVHRDLKPLNIMICRDKPNLAEAVKILDFGLAKIKSGELLGSFIQAQTTGLMGSPYYMAPEQWADEDVDPRSDIYSLGVMLFQMLTGDVPFKGSSIPAIMKKHISDPLPTFTELKVKLSFELEQAVRRTLHKEKEKRTPTVEHMIAELRGAIEPRPLGIHTTSGGAFPVSTLNIRTEPPRSRVFVDNVPVGTSRDDGWITLNGIQGGSHQVRVVHDGYDDWTGEVVCDGSTTGQVTASLNRGPGRIPKPGEKAAETIIDRRAHDTPARMADTRDNEPELRETVIQDWNTGDQRPVIDPKPNARSPLLLAGLSIAAIILLGAAGLGGAYMAGLVGTPAAAPPARPAPLPGPGGTTSEPSSPKTEMALIPGGTFQMGRNDGELKERPAHAVTIQTFWMDKTEVTNGEYLAFVNATGHRPPRHWVNGKPLSGTEMTPARYVDLDDAEAFARWRSARDGVTYRLPTEAEWEYAARNGERGDLYPWGNRWVPSNAVMGVSDSEPSSVGSRPGGQNQWGVMDLIGNVWEWTSTEIAPYPGSDLEVVKDPDERRIVVRGGSAHEDPAKVKVTSTFRVDIPSVQTEKTVGFRLVRPE